MADNFEQLSDDALEPMQVDWTSERRTLRKRKEKVHKHLKRGVNEKEMDNFTKEFLGYPWKSHSRRLTLPTEPSQDSFSFVDHSTRNSGGIIRDLEVQIGNALIPVDFHVLENNQNKNHSLLLGRAFMATVGAVCNMQTNQLCLTLINPDVHYDPVTVTRPQTSDTGVNTGLIAACHCNHEDEYETEYSGSIDSWTPPLIDGDIHPPIDNTSRESIDRSPANDTFTLPSHCYPRFDIATQLQTAIDYHYGDTISRHGDYSIGSWEDESLHKSFTVETELPETRSDEYDGDYHREKNIEYHGLAMDDRGLLHTSPVDATSTSIDSRPMPSIDSKTRNQRGACATPFALTYQSGICLSRQPPTIDSSNNPSIVIRYKHLSEEHLNNNTDYDLIPDEFGIFKDSVGRARGMDGSILNVSKEDFSELFAMHGSDPFCQPKEESPIRPSIDKRPLSSTDGLVTPAKDSYNKAEIDELVEEIDIRTLDDYHSKKLDDVYYPFENNIG
ncbi:hypothetical protein F2Q68_00031241 [Brassica cretica]|uniref:Uncharacterized protein n=1 Tax=Brassica cretica TaxID=69181 RepID=A0A8S9G7K6_BRACR|nr:hypothetical protein F2Q68_00031241 [Brassica cretica]